MMESQVVDLVQFHKCLKSNTLMHVHHLMDTVLASFRVHRCVERYIFELSSIPEVQNECILRYADEMLLLKTKHDTQERRREAERERLRRPRRVVTHRTSSGT